MVTKAVTSRSGVGALNMVCPINWLSPLNKGLAAHWRCVPGLTGGSRLVNLARPGDKDGYHGTLTNGATWGGALGRPGGFASISTVLASSQYVNCGTIAGVDGAAKCSFGGWIYRSATTLTAGAGFSAANSASPGNKFSFIWFSDGKIYTNGGHTVGYAESALTGTGWRNVWAVFDGTGATNADKVKLYVNGVQLAMTFVSSTVGTVLGTVNPFTIGRDALGRHSTGSYDDFCVLPGVAVSQSFISSTYQASLLGYPDELNWISQPVVVTDQAVGGFLPAWALNQHSYIIGGGLT